MPFKKFDNERYFGKLFAIRKFRQDYSDFINGLLRRLYQTGGNWGKLIQDGNYGVINTDYDLTKAPMNKEVRDFYASIYNNTDPKWSLLNYVNTNWSSFMHIVNTINYWIHTGQIKNEDPLTFQNNYFEELDRLKSILARYGEFIFFPSEKLTCFYKIMGAIATTTYYGNLGENITLKSLSRLGKISDVIQSEPGQLNDMYKGIDISFKLNGVKKTLQCKSFNNWMFTDERYVFLNISNPGWYNVDYFSFVSRGKGLLFVFDTRKNGVVYQEKIGSYIFDKDLLKYKVRL